jgi:hypothetical protein
MHLQRADSPPPDKRSPRRLIGWSVGGGVFITVLGIGLRFVGITWPVPYLTYSGSYLMQIFFQRFLEWIPWQYADNVISEFVLFFVLNVFGYAFVIFLVLRIFFPDRSGALPRMTEEK